jgi:hypothetical protein
MTNEDHNQIHDMMRDEMRSIRSDLHVISSNSHFFKKVAMFGVKK